MNFFKRQIGYILAAASLSVGCISSTTTSKNDTTVTVVTKVTKEGILPPGEWHVYNFPHETICVPSKWHFVDQNKILFMVSLNQNDANSYFGVVKEMKNEESGTAYLKRLYSLLKKGVIGSIDSCSVINAIYDDKTVFNCEFHLKIENEKYVLYSTIFEKDAYLFEIRLMAPEKRHDEFRQTYNNILYNFYCDKKLVFNDQDQIRKAQIIDMDALPPG